MRTRSKAWLWGLAGAVIVFSIGFYAQATSAGERGSFVMNFPAKGAEAGGPSPRDLSGEITVPLDSQGIIKQAFQPNVVEVASHVVTNVGTTPTRIRFEIDGFTEDVEWHSRDRAWNAATHTIDRPIAPGESVDFGLLVRLPRPLPDQRIPVKGVVRIVDASNDATLSMLPVSFVHASGKAGGDCCAP